MVGNAGSWTVGGIGPCHEMGKRHPATCNVQVLDLFADGPRETDRSPRRIGGAAGWALMEPEAGQRAGPNKRTRR